MASEYNTVKNSKPTVVKVYHPDGTIVSHKITSKYLELDQLKALIGGGHIETYPSTSKKHILVFDEEGKLKGMAPNKEGSLLSGRGEDFLCGPVLYCPRKLLEE